MVIVVSRENVGSMESATVPPWAIVHFLLLRGNCYLACWEEGVLVTYVDKPEWEAELYMVECFGRFG